MSDDAGPMSGIRSNSSHSDAIIALSEWLETAPGRYVLAWEQAQFDAVVADIFGFNAVQIGLPELQALRNNRMPFVFAAGESSEQLVDACDHDPSRLRAHVLVRLEELPFASQSIDLLVLPHALEFADDPHHVLREVERVLIPEGQVLISGFNPVSLWGLRQVVGRSSSAPFLPRAGQFLSLPRLKDWLKLLGLEVDRGHFGCYRPPFNADRWQSRFGFMESAGSRWWSYCGAIYMVHAVKRVKGMRLIGPPWKERKRVPAALQPTVSRARETSTTRGAAGIETSAQDCYADA
ncbi:MAG: class I SAM-dependent methyltransferase [Burkholderiaceae bacterium]